MKRTNYLINFLKFITDKALFRPIFGKYLQQKKEYFTSFKHLVFGHYSYQFNSNKTE